MSRRLYFVGLLLFLALGFPPLVQAGKGKMKFEIYQDKAKEFRWRLKASNGQVMATAGQGYKAKADCTKGVERLKGDLGKYKFEVYQDKAKEYRWRLKASNGQIVAASSDGYKAKSDCQNAIESIKKGVADARVDDMT
jgi:uncharacterized protein YegP (UPF0339 family)